MLRIRTLRHLSKRLGFAEAELVSIGDQAVRYYRPFLKEAPGKKPRLIDRPCGRLLEIQKRINQRFLAPLPYPAELHGGVRSRSIRSNALPHTNAASVLKLDIIDFFPSVTNKMVYDVFLTLLECSPDVSRVLTRLTTLSHRLPQGSPASPALANLYLAQRFLPALRQLCRLRAYRCTVYLDDITISSDHEIEPTDASQIIAWLEGIGLAVHPLGTDKSRILAQSQRIEITGVSANRSLGKSKKWRNHLRAEIHHLLRSRASIDQQPDLARIRGKVEHLKYINEGQARPFEHKLKDVNAVT